MSFLARTLLILILIAPPALAEKRVALVIGNSAYRNAPALANPRNDAEALAESLKRLNFEVIAGTDLDKVGMERLLRRFSDALERADVALAFYAGHGLQVHGRNYLVPVDARLEKENDLRFDAVSLDDLQQLMETSQRVNILILDACRDNPLARNLARMMGTRSGGIGRGLGETKAGIGTLIVYATQPGNVALDGEGRNSPFTAALLKYIEAPGLEIRQVLTRVRNEVITTTRDKQVLWDSSSLRGDFYFAAAPSVAPPPAPRAPAAPPPSAEFETLFWQSVKDSRNIADFKAYLERWPNGVFAPLARIRIAELERASGDEARRAEEQRKKSAEEQRDDAERKARDEVRQDAERKRNQADAIARTAGQRLDQARAALRQNQYLDARRLAEESAALAKEAGGLSAVSALVQTVARDLDAFRRDLDKRIEARAAVLVREARGFIAAKKFAEAEKRLVEAERLASASTVAARRELEAAQGRAEAEAKKKAAEEGKPGAADPKKQAQTAASWYAPDRKRGLIAFAHKKATLEPGAIAALERLAASLQGQTDYKITLVAAADRTEGNPGELQALSRARLAAVQQWLGGKGIAASALRIGIAAARGEGPEYRIVSLAAEIADAEAKRKESPGPPTGDPAAPAGDLAVRLVGTQWAGTLLGGEVQATSHGWDFSAYVRFKASGVMELITTPIPSARGSGVSPGINADDRGTWSVTGGRVCVKFSRLARSEQVCYAAITNADGSVTLTGAGLLAGKRFSK